MGIDKGLHLSSGNGHWASSWIWRECIIFEGILALEMGRIPLGLGMGKVSSFSRNVKMEDGGDSTDGEGSEVSRCKFAIMDTFWIRIAKVFIDRNWLYEFTGKALTPVLKLTSFPTTTPTSTQYDPKKLSTSESQHLMEQLESLDLEVRRIYVPPEWKVDLESTFGKDSSLDPSRPSNRRKNGNGNSVGGGCTLQKGLIALLRALSLLTLHRAPFALFISYLPLYPSPMPTSKWSTQLRYSLESTYYSSRCTIAILRYVAVEQFQLVCRYRGLFWRGAVLGCVSAISVAFLL